MLCGSLKTLPLMELLPLLKDQEGALELWNLEGIPPTTLYLKPGRIRHIAQGKGRLIPLRPRWPSWPSSFPGRGALSSSPGPGRPLRNGLTGLSMGSSCPRSPLGTSLSITGCIFPIRRPPSSLSMAEKGRPKRPDGSAKGRVLEVAWPHLERGATAFELAKALDLPLDLVRYQLFGLRRAGLLEERGSFEGPVLGGVR